MIEIRIPSKNITLPFKSFIFPGGEVGFKFTKEAMFNSDESVEVQIFASATCSDDFMGLAMAKDALEQLGYRNITLVLPYVPYGRQDRKCDSGEAFSLKVFAGLLNSLRFKKIVIFDPHSDVTPALIDNVKVIDQLSIIDKLPLEVK